MSTPKRVSVPAESQESGLTNHFLHPRNAGKEGIMKKHNITYRRATLTKIAVAVALIACAYAIYEFQTRRSVAIENQPIELSDQTPAPVIYFRADTITHETRAPMISSDARALEQRLDEEQAIREHHAVEVQEKRLAPTTPSFEDDSAPWSEPTPIEENSVKNRILHP